MTNAVDKHCMIRAIDELVSSDEQWLLGILRAIPFGKVIVTKQAGAIVTAEKQEMLKPPQ